LEATAQALGCSAESLNAPRILLEHGWVGPAIAGEEVPATQSQFGGPFEYPPVGSGPP